MARPRRERIRCRSCGQSVTYGLSVCPRCGHNPARLRTRWSTTILAVLVGVTAGIVLFPIVPHPALTMAAVTPGPPATIVVIVRPTFTPTTTPTVPPSATPTSTATATPQASATATSPPLRASAGAPTSIPSPSPTPKPTVEPPRLVSPPDQAEYGGEDTQIILQWQGTLQEGQQFAVTVRYVDRNEETKTTGSWLRTNRWQVPNKDVFRNISLSLHALKWDVTIIDGSGNPISAPSESRIFSWHP
jgi:hypothetical protein